ncbi:MAG: crossover junction endodeoxyribonuclease RuvC [Spirochaetota bacterium]|nr:crossover junction endodeoxyribonuclease RuvC [Spirochaetota bacterium]
MYFLGIDPGYGRLGYGVIHAEYGAKPKYVECGVFETESDMPESERLLYIESNLLLLISKYIISYCAIEQVFFRKNLTTGIQLIQARGVVLLCMAKNNIPYISVSPTSLKKMITGSGRGEKKQIENIVSKLLKINEIPGPDDAADGLSLALYAWLSHRKIKII